MSAQPASLDRARRHIAQDLKALAAHAEELLEAAAATSGETVDEARDRLKGALGRVREQIDDVEASAVEKGRAMVNATETAVRERPWQALAATMLLGTVVGAIAGASAVHYARH